MAADVEPARGCEMPSLRMVSVVALATLGPLATQAAEPPSLLRLETERVIVFKDGFSLIVKSGTATSDADGEIYTDQVPDAAILGAFWVFAEGEAIVGMRAGLHEEETTVEKSTTCLDTIGILHANRGKVARVVMDDGSEHAGTIQHVLVEPGAEEPSRPDPRRLVATTLRTFGPAGSNFVLRGDEGDVLLRAGSVRALTVRDMAVDCPRTETTTTVGKRLRLGFGGSRREHRVTLMYFGPGIRWIPTYRVELSEKKPDRARLSLQAELLNESEDLRGVPVDLVVGVPHFRFRDVVSPLVLEKELRRALEEVAPQVMGQSAFSNVGFSSRAGEWRRETAEPARLDLPDELTAGTSQDLFLYHLPPSTLAKGERMVAPIFDATVSCRHVYTWDARVKRVDRPNSSAAEVSSPLALSMNEVWHQVELINATEVPWTTGPALVTEGQLPFGQDLLTYTPVGGRVRVPVTVSVNTRASLSEEEVAREPHALEWSGYHYVRVANRVKLELHNFMPENADAEITLRFGGHADVASGGGRISLRAHDPDDWENYRGQPAVNNSSTVSWTARVLAGGTFAPTVDYHYFARE